MYKNQQHRHIVVINNVKREKEGNTKCPQEDLNFKILPHVLVMLLMLVTICMSTLHSFPHLFPHLKENLGEGKHMHKYEFNTQPYIKLFVAIRKLIKSLRYMCIFLYTCSAT